jgi:3-dehydrosphinganine reductase
MPAHALISGGSSGIGLALAARLAARGFDLSLLARDEARLGAARLSLQERASRPDQHVDVYPVDVADWTRTRDAVSAAIAERGPPQLVVASAGMVVPGRFAELPLDVFERTMAVNYFGALHLARATVPAMRQSGGAGGRLVFISSGAAFLGFYGYTAYAPSKFAVRGLAEALRNECKPAGIAVSVVYPPDTDTPQLHAENELRPEATRQIAAGSRVLSADVVAERILRGIDRGRFVIAPGFEMTAMAILHSLAAPLLNRFLYDPIVARCGDDA